MGDELNIIIVSSSVIIAFIGLFFVIRIWMVWKLVDIQLLKARVFLDRGFLVKNWIYVFLIGAFIAVRRVVELLELSGYQVKGMGVTFLFNLLGLAVIFLLVRLAYDWYKLVYSAISSHAERFLKSSEDG
ncbi:MAG: hypothetical protein OIN88_08780 [Candidatus Methanoperedens sp.]|nr:hypothetical protein [Candidatus Methanoperedens sp.]MCZ7361374.1 hypothetical protein [Candidatus Methanoperedens sp.]HLB71563.1 hypothetical protein [Candidatus Methanoperedens sp.]